MWKRDWPKCYNNRGVAYYDNKQYDQAIADYNRAIEINPKDAYPFSNRGPTTNPNATWAVLSPTTARPSS
jgi:tetratricopeptide (TPR) repeat protein